jgi:hypothetical protein
MRLSFAPPLKTGWEGHEEYLDIQVDGPPGEIRDTCNARLPEGLRIEHVYVLSDRAPKIAADVRAATIAARVRYDCAFGADCGRPGDRVQELDRDLRVRLAGGDPGGGDDEPRVIEARASICGDDVEVRYTTTMISGKIVAPDQILTEALADPDGFDVPPTLARVAQYVERGGELVSPISKGVLLNTS